MKIAHILPPSVLSDVQDYLSDYALLLPSLAANMTYRDFYKNESGLKIMDNGIAEGLRTSFEHQLVSAGVMGCSEVVLPDVMKNSDATLRAVAEVFYQAFEARKKFKFMLVAQGDTVPECIHMVQQASNLFPGVISSIGIPRHILSQGRTARVKIAEGIRVFGFHGPIHLLGTYPEQPQELRDFHGSYKTLDIRGVDTSLAWNATLGGIDLSDERENKNKIPRQPIELFARAELFDVNDRLLIDNIDTLNNWSK